jgi:hypothetical protein
MRSQLQVATRRYIDEQAVWTLMRFADEPVERVPSRLVTRLQRGDPRGADALERASSTSGSINSATVMRTPELASSRLEFNGPVNGAARNRAILSRESRLVANKNSALAGHFESG